MAGVAAQEASPPTCRSSSPYVDCATEAHRRIWRSSERQPLIDEVSANFCGQRVSHGQRNGSPRPYSRISRPEPLLSLPSRSSSVFTRLSGPHSRPATSQKMW
jgi:hypothetical protein